VEEDLLVAGCTSRCKSQRIEKDMTACIKLCYNWPGTCLHKESCSSCKQTVVLMAKPQWVVFGCPYPVVVQVEVACTEARMTERIEKDMLAYMKVWCNYPRNSLYSQ